MQEGPFVLDPKLAAIYPPSSLPYSLSTFGRVRRALRLEGSPGAGVRARPRRDAFERASIAPAPLLNHSIPGAFACMANTSR